eukprot:c1675_g1_i1.p1 GENE.c1675_g1_i1~~c1675_g1_i1.p1  ORF type:complete len:248 (+),score=61.54 c1675_g1_i1:41-784(+)
MEPPKTPKPVDTRLMDEIQKVLAENPNQSLESVLQVISPELRSANLRCDWCGNAVEIKGGRTLHFANKKPVCDVCWVDEQADEMGLLIVKPDALSDGERIKKILTNNGFGIICVHERKLLTNEVNQICDPSDRSATAFLTGGKSLVMCVSRKNVIEKLVEIVGPENPDEAKQTAPNSLRALYGTDHMRNAIHIATTDMDASWQLPLFFPHAKFEIVDEQLVDQKTTSNPKTTTAAKPRTLAPIPRNK